ncbi:MAG: DUF4258 domain-containing protein [Cyanobacteriota bacterium]
MEYATLRFSGHAVRQMFRRRISENEVETVIRNGVLVADYPDDQPYPSCLLLGWANRRPIHVVAAKDSETQTIYVVTAYEPDPDIWKADFTQRRPQP